MAYRVSELRKIAWTAIAIAALAAARGGAGPDGVSGGIPAVRVRALADTVGYATTAEQIEAVIALAESLEADRFESNAALRSRRGAQGMLGAIAPHDDYRYAARVYVHALREIRTPLVVLVGVSHSARRRGIQDKLIFDSYDAWKGPYGECPVSPLRRDIVAALPPELVLVSDEIQSEEHSLEAFIPFLQYYNRDVEILPILVTRLRGALFDEAAGQLAAALHDAAHRRGMMIGRDYAVLVSADCVHYGDDRWGGRNYAPFGVDADGYEKAVEQDLSIARSTLTEVLSRDRIAGFRRIVERDDFQWPYHVTWCGVYSIPFGLTVLLEAAGLDGREPPEGYLLQYGTSIDPGPLPLEGTGLGFTAVNTMRHWVGYAAVGYW